MSSKKGFQASMVLGFLLVFFSALAGGRYAAAEEDDAGLLRPQAVWSKQQRVSTTSDNGAFVPVLKASSTGRLMIMYNYETDQGVENPFYAQSTDGGDNWSEPDAVHSSSTGARQVAFDFAGNTAHAVWRVRTTNQADEEIDKIWHASEGQWANNGRNLIVNAGARAFDPEIAAGPDGVLHVVWTQQTSQSDMLYYSHSRNGGGAWSSPEALTTGLNKASATEIAVDENGDVHVVWEERIFDGSPFRYEVYYRRGNVTATDVNWQQPLEISEDPDAPGDPRQPAIAADGSDLHVAFSRRLDSDAQYPYYISYSSTDGWDDPPTNTSPGNPVEINTTTPFFLVSTLAECGGAVHLYYHGAIDPNPKEQVLGASYKGTWSPRVVVTEPDTRSINPSVVCTGATVHLAYSVIFEVNSNHQTFYIRRSPTVYLPTVYSQ